MKRTTLGWTGVVVGGLAILVVLAWRFATPRLVVPIGVVVITLDTTRADRLSPYGSMDVSLPSLERLAREGVVFDDASAAAPLTLPSHTSIFTGLLPLNHGVRDNADAPLDQSHTTMAEVLQARGFRTGAFVGSVVLGAERGLAQGFDTYRGVAITDRQGPEAMQRRGDAVVNDAIQWLDSTGDSPFFLWTHLYDPHRPYQPPEPFYSTFGHDPYIGEIAYADSQVGRLLDALEKKQLLDRVIVVIAGDHGESLGDHGERDHGIFVYQEVLRVPFIIRARRLQPSRVGEVVRLTDVVPTVLELLDIPSPKLDGVSLVSLMSGRSENIDLESYSESLYPERLGWSPLYALRQGRFKLIDAPRPELYDLDSDPFERENIYEVRASTARAMATRLTEIVTRAKAVKRLEAPVAPEVQARLAALGYVASAVARDPSDRSPRPDPKDCIGSHARMLRFEPVNPICGPGLPPHR
jgi:choline-sulfatase